MPRCRNRPCPQKGIKTTCNPLGRPILRRRCHLALILPGQSTGATTLSRTSSIPGGTSSQCRQNQSNVYKQLHNSSTSNSIQHPLKDSDTFKYLGSLVPDSYKDFKQRKAQAWSAMAKLDRVWKSNISRKCKLHFFQASVESILLYGAETWTFTQEMENRVNGCYTRLLRKALNIRWQDHLTKNCTKTSRNSPPKSEQDALDLQDTVLEPWINQSVNAYSGPRRTDTLVVVGPV